MSHAKQVATFYHNSLSQVAEGYGQILEMFATENAALRASIAEKDKMLAEAFAQKKKADEGAVPPIDHHPAEGYKSEGGELQGNRIAAFTVLKERDSTKDTIVLHLPIETAKGLRHILMKSTGNQIGDLFPVLADALAIRSKYRRA